MSETAIKSRFERIRQLIGEIRGIIDMCVSHLRSGDGIYLMYFESACASSEAKVRHWTLAMNLNRDKPTMKMLNEEIKKLEKKRDELNKECGYSFGYY